MSDLPQRVQIVEHRADMHSELLHQNAVSIGRLADAAAKNAETIAGLNEIVAGLLDWRDTIDIRDQTIIDKSNDIQARLITMDWDRVIHNLASAIERLDATTPQALIREHDRLKRALHLTWQIGGAAFGILLFVLLWHSAVTSAALSRLGG